MIEIDLARLLSFGVLGAFLAGCFFAALRWNASLYVGSGSLWKPLGLHLTRFFVVGAVLTLCARHGALALLSSVAGFQLVRMIAVNTKKVSGQTAL